jgi:hypothetical protein
MMGRQPWSEAGLAIVCCRIGGIRRIITLNPAERHPKNDVQ